MFCDECAYNERTFEDWPCVVCRFGDHAVPKEREVDILQKAYDDGFKCGYEQARCDYEPEWVPVSERLPKENGAYLTTSMFGKVHCDRWDGRNFNRTEMVIAWMELPEEYKGNHESTDSLRGITAGVQSF